MVVLHILRILTFGTLDSFEQRHSAGNALDKIVSGYHAVYGGQLDEDAILGKCTNAISCIQKVDKEIGGDINSGMFFMLTVGRSAEFLIAYIWIIWYPKMLQSISFSNFLLNV